MTRRTATTTIRNKALRRGVMTIVRVLLTTTVESLGDVGDVVEVADGYARNYLFPRRLATQPTPHNIACYTRSKAQHEVELEEREARALHLRDVLADRTLVFVRKAHDDDRLYGSVRVEDIVSQIEEETGERIEPSRVELPVPIETLGPHAVTINLYKDIAVELRIRVDSETDSNKEGAKEA